MNDVHDLATELVSIPSHEDETAAGDAIERWLRDQTDASVVRDDVGNVIARRGDGDRSLALVGHHDVVPPDDRQVEGDEYVVERRDGRLYGRGSADMKGAVAAAMCAFRDADPACELVFASFVGEEIGGVGARHAIDEGFAPTWAIVGEGSTDYSAPGVTDVAVAHKGRRGSTVTVHGESAHASNPSEGDNAIYRACDVVDELRSIEAPTVTVPGTGTGESDVAGASGSDVTAGGESDVTDASGSDVEPADQDDGWAGRPTLSGSVVVTEIDGGTAWNVVPAECRITVDERTVPGERAPIEDVERHPRVTVTIDQDLPPMRCDDRPFAQTVLDAASRSQEGEPAMVAKPHATDAGWLAQAGTACVICGAAEPGEAHTDTESVSLEVLDRCYETYRRAAETVN